jgi:integrase
MNLALRRMGFGKDQATSHGFRATASTLLNESGLWSADAIEAELGHVSGDEVRRAYHRALYWEDTGKEWQIGGQALWTNIDTPDLIRKMTAAFRRIVSGLHE